MTFFVSFFFSVSTHENNTKEHCIVVVKLAANLFSGEDEMSSIKNIANLAIFHDFSIFELKNFFSKNIENFQNRCKSIRKCPKMLHNDRRCLLRDYSELDRQICAVSHIYHISDYTKKPKFFDPKIFLKKIKKNKMCALSRKLHISYMLHAKFQLTQR